MHCIHMNSRKNGHIKLALSSFRRSNVYVITYTHSRKSAQNHLSNILAYAKSLGYCILNQGLGRSYPPYTLYPLYLDKVSIYLDKVPIDLDKVPNPAAGQIIYTSRSWTGKNVMTTSTISMY